MSFENKYPYTDFHELNLDWFLARFKEVTDQVTTLDATVHEFTTFVTNYFDNLDVQQEINNKLNEMYASGELSALIQPLFDTYKTEIDHEVSVQNNAISTQNGRISVLEGRMDTFSHLTDGSTTGDAELADIRVEFNGITAATAGDAVRQQAALLNRNIAAIQDIIFTDGYINNAGNVAGGTPRRHSNKLICGAGNSVTYSGETNSTSVLGISFYDANGAFISGYNNNGTIGTDITVTSPANALYCIISTNTTYENNTTFKVSTNGITITNGRITEIENELGSFIPFVTTGSTRSDYYTDISDIYKAEIVEPGYEISLYFPDSSSTNWRTEFLMSDFPTAVSMRLRKSDNSAMPANSALRACSCIRNSTFLKYGMIVEGDVNVSDPVGYVDCDNGSDTNDGMKFTTAFKTIQKAVNEGRKNIIVKAGTYTSVTIQNKSGIKIIPYKADESYDQSTMLDNPKIIIDADSTDQYGLKMVNCSNCVIESVTVTDATVNGFQIEDSENIRLKDCIAYDIPNGMGFQFRESNADCVNCIAHDIGTMGGGQHRDGFNIHGTGSVNFYNCSAYNCEDDGISHHDATNGIIDGGEFHHCGKGGVASPTYGSRVNITGIYSHDNGHGIYAVSDDTYANSPVTINVSNCALTDNTVDITCRYTAMNIWNSIYNTTSTQGSGGINPIS